MRNTFLRRSAQRGDDWLQQHAPPRESAAIAASPVAASDILTLDAGPANKFVRADESGGILYGCASPRARSADATRPPSQHAMSSETSGSMRASQSETARGRPAWRWWTTLNGDTRASDLLSNTRRGSARRRASTRLWRVAARIGAMERAHHDLAGGLRPVR